MHFKNSVKAYIKNIYTIVVETYVIIENSRILHKFDAVQEFYEKLEQK